ncbi:MAG: hypothetical protein ACPGVP_13760 [Thiolinea sp.]
MKKRLNYTEVASNSIGFSTFGYAGSKLIYHLTTSQIANPL